MKFDMGRAWSQATAMLSANRDLIAVVSGVFFFLPYLALMLMIPDLSAELPRPEPGADPQAMIDAVMAIYGRVWPWLVLMAILQGIGSLALLVLLRDSTRPTLGEALRLGAIAFLPYLAAQLTLGVAIAVVVALLAGGAAAISPAVTVLAILVACVAAVYLAVKFSLTMPVIGIERIYNPFTALARSWRLTKGNSLRLFFFYFLIFVAGLIVVIVIEMIFGLLFALFGAQGALIGNGIVSSLLNAGWATLFLAVLAAAHRQLSGPSDGNLAEVSNRR
jgi:hypothetical protein